MARLARVHMLLEIVLVGAFLVVCAWHIRAQDARIARIEAERARVPLLTERTLVQVTDASADGRSRVNTRTVELWQYTDQAHAGVAQKTQNEVWMLQQGLEQAAHDKLSYDDTLQIIHTWCDNITHSTEHAYDYDLRQAKSSGTP